MQTEKILLSICIPTFNRANILNETIKKIVSDIDFDHNVELVISDNCSTDNTKEIVEKYCLQFKNVKYFRNDINISDNNFWLALTRGNGIYRKLQNDNLAFKLGSLARIKMDIYDNLKNNKPIFFSGGTIYTKKKNESIICNSLDEYVQSISTFVTYISNFGAYSKDLEIVSNPNLYQDLKLCQNDWSYQITEKRNGCIIYDYEIYEIIPIPLGVRKGYNWFNVHLNNYYKIMKPYIIKGSISLKTYTGDRINLIKYFRPELIKIFIYNYDRNWKFDTKGTFKLFWKYYKYIPLFYLHIIFYPVGFLYAFFYLIKYSIRRDSRLFKTLVLLKSKTI